ncbi:beta-1,4-N-acetylgalactosaminyltransferase 3-like [Stylophora pistillata]|uniref:Beta-1,4-N-acetylgalactosaminyltransferase n=1 Tax=Stylophora pistillata TaxID=50429 RepID=A0A2B4RZV4_STYPI|nr:beta-1,4-N-acetylgalactosaminyltransferase 3-like [Stylophora pistillata]XP_022796668.1 beta-1,4-N-acetylgalactosaminyltransferase 3-like [Stylophora pistillata]PFX21772.1 N-acetyl-beta-glucosaminyl-glycoprotein 4-beta-N-acetylgalactosaminyltransferase 1 [Stylophora pistillata]
MGAVNVHKWRNMCGSDISQLRESMLFPHLPDEQFETFIAEFKIQDNTEHYGQRIFGFLYPPSSMSYHFGIASDDTSEFWLSLSENPHGKELRAKVFSNNTSAWTTENVLNKYPYQISKAVNLFQGKKYYFEILHKQGIENGFVQLYWKSALDDDFKLINAKYVSTFLNTIPFPSEKKDLLHGAFSGQYQHELALRKSKRFRKEYLSFYSLPFLPRRSYLPSCEYKSSYILQHGVYTYEGVKAVPESIVYPEDDTAMGDPGYLISWPNTVANKDAIQAVVDKLMTSLRLGTSKNYFLKRIHKILQRTDPVYGDRYSIDLEVGLEGTEQSFRLSEHVFQEKVNHSLCFQDGMHWNNEAKVYFIVPVKDQGRWVYHFINELTIASFLTADTNFHVIIVDFESQDIDLPKAFDTSLIRNRHTIISLQGKFFKTLALNTAVEHVPRAQDLLFLFDLHTDVPVDMLDSVRKYTIEGRFVYAPIVGRLNCGSTYVDHQGFWELSGYGFLGVYKSDWQRFGGMNSALYQYKWGGEDWDILDRILNAKLEVERIKHPGLYHHYQIKQKTWN